MVWNSSKRRVRQHASAWLVTLSAVLAAACDGGTIPRTQVIVVIDATEDVRKQTRQLSVAVRGGPKGQEEDWRSAGKKDFAMQGATDWPVTVGLVPEEGRKPGRFEVVIEAFDGKKNVAFVEKIVRSGYVEQSTRQLDVLLDLGECEGERDLDECKGDASCVLCDERDPAKLPEYEEPAGRDGGLSGDGGTSPSGDGGGQGADAGASSPDDGGTSPNQDGGQDDEDAGGGTGPKSDAGSEKCTGDAECDDGDPCNGQEQCVKGGCEDGKPLVCEEDDNPCTTVACVEGEGCKPQDNTEACDDGDPCTDEDVCSDGECISGESRQCHSREVCSPDDGECVCAEGYERCEDNGVCQEVGTACACGGVWMCGEDGERECVEQQGECAERLGDIENCELLLPVLKTGQRTCVESESEGEVSCIWTDCLEL